MSVSVPLPWHLFEQMYLIVCEFGRRYWVTVTPRTEDQIRMIWVVLSYLNSNRIWILAKPSRLPAAPRPLQFPPLSASSEQPSRSRSFSLTTSTAGSHARSASVKAGPGPHRWRHGGETNRPELAHLQPKQQQWGQWQEEKPQCSRLYCLARKSRRRGRWGRWEEEVAGRQESL